MSEQLNNRVKLTDTARNELFKELSDHGFDVKAISVHLKLHERTIRDWRRGKYTIPREHFLLLIEITGRQFTADQAVVVPRWWYTSAAGFKGGKAYVAKYGVAGTPESRRVGGAISYAKRRFDTDSIYARKSIVMPERSDELAEFVGIMLGDGHVDHYQIMIALDSETDREYVGYVTNLIEKLFAVKVVTALRTKARCVTLTVSSIELVEYLLSIGLLRGNKVTQQVAIPDWIMHDRDYAHSCVRGLFDTDGSVFLEKHQINGAQYCYPRMAFVNMSVPLRNGVHEILQELGIDVRIHAERNVTIGRFTDMEKYFRIIGSNNPKHLRRFAEYGGVG